MPIRFYQRGRRKPPSRVIRPTRARDEALNAHMQEAFKSEWLGATTRLRQNLSSKDMADAYMSGDYSDLFKQIKLGRFDAYADEIAQTLGHTADSAAHRAASQLRDPKLLRYDLANPRINKFLDTHTGSLIQAVNDEFHLTVQTLVKARFARGLSTGNLQMGLLEPTTRNGVAGFVLKNSLGLDSRSALALANRASSGKFSQAELDEYEDTLHVRRARLIARTEVAQALSEGQLSVWSEATDQGLLDPEKARKTWIVDGNPCPKICEPMDGISVGINEDFLLPNGVTVSGPGAHPACECAMMLDIEGDDDVAGSNRQNYEG